MCVTSLYITITYLGRVNDGLCRRLCTFRSTCSIIWIIIVQKTTIRLSTTHEWNNIDFFLKPVIFFLKKNSLYLTLYSSTMPDVQDLWIQDSTFNLASPTKSYIWMMSLTVTWHFCWLHCPPGHHAPPATTKVDRCSIWRERATNDAFLSSFSYADARNALSYLKVQIFPLCLRHLAFGAIN